MYRIIGKERKEIRLHRAQGRLATVCSVRNHRAYLQVEGEEAVRKQRHREEGLGGAGSKQEPRPPPRPARHTHTLCTLKTAIVSSCAGGKEEGRADGEALVL